MKIIKLHEFDKPEDIHVIPFLEFYCGDLVSTICYEAIPENHLEKRPDYYIHEIKAVVEVSEIYDEESNKRSAQWSKITQKLKQDIKNHPKLSHVKGLYLLDTPPVFKFRTNKNMIKKAADQIVEAVIAGQRTTVVFGVTFKIKRVSDKDNDIYFGTFSGGSIDPATTIHKNIFNKLGTANKQLSFVPKGKEVEKRILLLVNRYTFANRISEVIRGLSYAYQEILSYSNIEEVWFQNPTEHGAPTHVLLYTKEFLQQYDTKRLDLTKINAELFGAWFSSFESIGDEHKEKLFAGLRTFLKSKKPHQVFDDKLTREEMARLGLWLVDKERFDETVWLIDQFIDDPDPVEPEHYEGDPESNYHEKIIAGEDPHIITTVRGNLAWVIQKLALRKNYIIKALDYTKTLLRYKNLYAKLQAIIPLIEIAARRQWLEELNPQEYKEFHDVTFDLLRNYAKYPPIAKRLTHVFYYFQDLTTEEALEVLERLKITDESAPLFIYFGIFRQRHYKNQDGRDKKCFDPKRLKKNLEEIIKNNDDQYTNLRGSIAWNFWKLLSKNPDEFDAISPYISLFLEQPYRKNIYDDIARIIKEWIEKKPEKCTPWFEKLLSNIAIYVKTNKQEGRNIWLMPEKIINYIAYHHPEKLETLIEQLVDLWIEGSYIGNPKSLFESYKGIANAGLKKATRTRFKSLYSKMKNLNPRLVQVDWKEAKAEKKAELGRPFDLD